MFFPIRFKTHVQLVPQELDVNIEKTLMTKLRKRYEGVCSRFGYIKPNTLQILHRSLGSFMKPHFNGHTRFEVLLVGEVCNPTQGMVVTAKVQAKNNLGILAESSVLNLPLLDIIVPRRSAGIASEVDLDAVNIGEEVFVEVLGKRYQLNDTKISIIGRIVKERRGIPSNEEADGAEPGDDAASEADETDADLDDVEGLDADDDGDGDDDDDDATDKPANASKIAEDAKRFAAMLRVGVATTDGVAKDVDADADADEELPEEPDDDEDVEEEESEEKEWE